MLLLKLTLKNFQETNVQILSIYQKERNRYLRSNWRKLTQEANNLCIWLIAHMMYHLILVVIMKEIFPFAQMFLRCKHKVNN